MCEKNNMNRIILSNSLKFNITYNSNTAFRNITMSTGIPWLTRKLVFGRSVVGGLYLLTVRGIWLESFVTHSTTSNA